MYDGGKIVVGLVVFALVATVPFWYGAVSGGTDAVPQLSKVDPANGTRCVEDTEFMRSEHMKLLEEWRLTVVRGTTADRFYEGPAPAGMQPPERSLTNTCLGCHTDKVNFCDKCHDYAVVSPDCWNCHIVPKGGK